MRTSLSLLLVLISAFGAAITGLPIPCAAQIAGDTKPAQEEPIDFARARELMQKKRNGGKLTEDEEAFVAKAQKAFQAREAARFAKGDKSGFKPLNEMSADDRYEGEDGGLYGQGKNEPPDAHRKAALEQLAKIEPLDAKGVLAKDGQIVFLSISMSNATQEFSYFKRIADKDAAKSPRVTIVDGAQGSQAMAEWATKDARPWTVAAERIEKAGVTPAQVQVAWVKLANKGPRGDLKEHGKKLFDDTAAVLHIAKERYPNLRIAYLGSRIYGGYANSGLNPEPYAYEGAFIVRSLIKEQAGGAKELNYDADKGAVKAPLLLWGPYLWADGVNSRSDGLVWKREDLAGDGTHPSQSGREKVAKLLLEFCQENELSKSWFAK